MTMTDPIADMLVCIHNGSRAKHPSVDVPFSKLKSEVAKLLQEKGFVKRWEKIEDGKQGILKIFLRYAADGEEVISGMKRVSKPGSRLWVKAEDVPEVHAGVGTAIVSTSKGIKTDEQCREENVGGEVLCYVW
jgi:small subunit ribosomal protein S8